MKVLIFVGLLVSSLQAATLQYHYDFTSYWKGNQWQGDWQKVAGYPVIPKLTAKILIPFGEEISSIAFKIGEEMSTRELHFPRAPYPLPLCDDKTVTLSAVPEFTADQSYPGSHFGEHTVVTKHGYEIAFISLFPIEYFPVRQESFKIDVIDVVVQTQPTHSSTLYRGIARDREEVKGLLDSEKDLTTYPLTQANPTVDYLVVGPQNLLQDQDAHSITALLTEKNSRGIRTATQTIEDIQANVQGKNLQEKIRNAIIQHYKNEGIQYVLLVGNGYSITPTKILKVNVSEGSIPSDYYFACLDGDFSSKQKDVACEVAVGRAPVSNVTELRAFVTKTLAMEAVTPSDARVWNTLAFGEKLDDQTLGSKLIDKLVTGGTGGNSTYQGYPATAKFDKMYETFNQQFTGDDVIAKLNSGNFYTVNHLGHANENYCMEFMDTQISRLNNTMPFFGITQGCHPGNLNGKNWASEMVVLASGGPAAMVANSNYGFYDGSGSTDGPSNHYHQAFYDTVFKDSLRNLGKIHYRAKEKLIPEMTSDEIMRWVVYETNLLGDPELQLKFGTN